MELTLRHHGVTEFATRNEAHFTNFGFTASGIRGRIEARADDH